MYRWLPWPIQKWQRASKKEYRDNARGIAGAMIEASFSARIAPINKHDSRVWQYGLIEIWPSYRYRKPREIFSTPDRRP
jgi:hypothetical protein